MKPIKILYIAELIISIVVWIICLQIFILDYDASGDTIFKSMRTVPYFFLWLILSFVIIWLLLQIKYIINKDGVDVSRDVAKTIIRIPIFYGLLIAIAYMFKYWIKNH